MKQHPDTTSCRSAWINPVNIGTEKESWFCREHKVAIWPNRGTDMVTEDSTPPQGNSHPPKNQTIPNIQPATWKMNEPIPHFDDEVINPIREGEGVDPKLYFGIDSDEIVAQIQVAYQEAGYRRPGAGLRGNLMTGSEWFSRFKAELDKDTTCDFNKATLDAIKRAAGVSDE